MPVSWDILGMSCDESSCVEVFDAAHMTVSAGPRASMHPKRCRTMKKLAQCGIPVLMGKSRFNVHTYECFPT